MARSGTGVGVEPAAPCDVSDYPCEQCQASVRRGREAVHGSRSVENVIPGEVFMPSHSVHERPLSYPFRTDGSWSVGGRWNQQLTVFPGITRFRVV